MNEDRVWELLQQQHGVVSRSQLLAAQRSSSWVARRVSSGELVAMLAGIYRHRAHQQTWHQRAWAGLLLGGDHCAISHASAAWLLKLDGFNQREPREVELTVLEPSQPRSRPGWRFCRTKVLKPRDTTLVRGLRTTNIPRTIADLAGRASIDSVETAFNSEARFTSQLNERVSQTLNRLGSTRRGCGALKAMLAHHIPTDSRLETKVLKALLRAGLGPVATQHIITDNTCRHIATVDFAWPSRKVVVLSHGYGEHSRRHRWERDVDQGAALAANGWVVVPVSWRSFHENPQRFISQLALVLEARRHRIDAEALATEHA